MGPFISQLGTAAYQALLQFANSAGGKYMASKAVIESKKKIISWWNTL